MIFSFCSKSILLYSTSRNWKSENAFLLCELNSVWFCQYRRHWIEGGRLEKPRPFLCHAGPPHWLHWAFLKVWLAFVPGVQITVKELQNQVLNPSLGSREHSCLPVIWISASQCSILSDYHETNQHSSEIYTSSVLQTLHLQSCRAGDPCNHLLYVTSGLVLF